MKSAQPGDVTVRALRPADRLALQAACLRNFAELSAALPLPSVLLHAPADDQWVPRLLAYRDAKTAYPYVVLDRAEIIGAIALHDVVRSEHADLTFWVDAQACGRGAATAAVAQIRVIAQDCIGLRRVASAALLSNGAAHRVLEKNKFEMVRRMPRYRFVAGGWQDHLLFHQILAGD